MIMRLPNVSKRYLLRAAINLYFIGFDSPPLFKGEIDQLDDGTYRDDHCLSVFCAAFIKLFSENAYDDFQNACVDASRHKCNAQRIRFFLMCCDHEMDSAKKSAPPLVFRWNDYSIYEKSGNFAEALAEAEKRSSWFLAEKPQFCISQIKEFVRCVMDVEDGSFSNIARIILYGSLAKGTNTPSSDIDLLLIFASMDPTNGLVATCFGKEFKKISGVFPDCHLTVSGRKDAFVDWISKYGVNMYDKK